MMVCVFMSSATMLSRHCDFLAPGGESLRKYPIQGDDRTHDHAKWRQDKMNHGCVSFFLALRSVC